MEPRIQYAKTEDGVSIAYWTLGEGMPLIHMPLPFTHLQLELEFPEYRHWYERLAENRKLVRYDYRGFGLSERGTTDYSLDKWVLELEAVVDRLGLERFSLFGLMHTGPPATVYAARHPDRVSHLILWSAYSHHADWTDSPPIEATRAMMERDWTTYTESIASVLLGWSEGEPARRFASLIRECVTPEATLASIRATLDVDLRALLPKVRAPTLVLHRRQAAFLGVGAATSLSSGIPDARLALLDGESGAPYLGDTEAVLRAIDDFLSEGEDAAAASEAPQAGTVHTILFTDIESSTALTQRLGDAKAQELLRTHNTIVRDALKKHSGSEIKHTGDGIMASFPSASGALECAVAIQRAVAEHHAEPVEASLRVRIGLNAGEPVAEEEDLFGTAVQLAKRICDHAEPGQILAPIVVRELAAGKRFLFADLGDAMPKGFEQPVRLYEVRWRD